MGEEEYKGSSSIDMLGQLQSSRYASGPNVADPGSPNVATFHCVIFLSRTSFVFYKLQTGHLSLLGLQTKTKR